VLVKAVTTLDVLSRGRAALGVGAGWDVAEHDAYGIPFPPTGERFDRLDEALRVSRALFTQQPATFHGAHYAIAGAYNSPRPVHRSIPILVAVGGERRTLDLVARYGDACNLFAGRDEARKLDLLREHCEAVGRDYDTIFKTAYYVFDTSRGTQRIVDELGALAGLGFHAAIGAVRDVWDVTPLEVIGSEVIPAVADF